MGLGMNEFLRVQSEYSRIEKEEANDAKARKLAQWVNGQDYTPEQKKAVKEAFKHYAMVPTGAGGYEELLGVGLQDNDAYALDGILGDLEPEKGKKSVSYQQKWRAVLDYGLDEEEEMAALQAVSTESQYKRFATGLEFGVEPEIYVSVREAMPEFDEDGNGRYTQAEIEDALDEIDGLTNRQRAVLWQLLSGSKSARNNPYSVSIGWDVLEYMDAYTDETPEAVLPIA